MVEHAGHDQESAAERNMPPETGTSSSTEAERIAADEARIEAAVRERLRQWAHVSGLQNWDYPPQPPQMPPQVQQ